MLDGKLPPPIPPAILTYLGHLQFQLLDHLGIDRLHASVGSSLGGMQVDQRLDCRGTMLTIGPLEFTGSCGVSRPRGLLHKHQFRT
jgi:hypothetical protein